MDAMLEQFLHRLPVMAGLDEEALAYLSGLTREESYAPGAVIVEEGAPGDRVYFVRAGKVQVVKRDEADPAVELIVFGAGDFFGEMSLVESVVRSASVIALEPTQLASLGNLDFYRLYKHRPDQYGIVMLNIARDLARRLRRLDEEFCHRAH